MKKYKIILVMTLCAMIILASNYRVSNAYDFTSKNITVKNDTQATKEKLYPVLILTNNTNDDLNVSYDFYVNKNDTSEYNGEILIKAKQSIQLELPQLHHLGDNQESTTIWFSWMEKSKLKPSQTQIETSIFSNPIAPPPVEPPPLELGLK